MLSNQPPRDNVVATRGALVTLLTRQLAPLYSGQQIAVTLAEWLTPLPCEDIVRALRPTPDETANALADALLRDSTRRHPQDAIADLVAAEYPRLGHAERIRLVTFVQAARAIAFDCDGVVTEEALSAKGIPAADRARFADHGRRLLAILNDATVPTPEVAGNPAERLLEVGVRAYTRMSFAA